MEPTPSFRLDDIKTEGLEGEPLVLACAIEKPRYELRPDETFNFTVDYTVVDFAVHVFWAGVGIYGALTLYKWCFCPEFWPTVCTCDVDDSCSCYEYSV